MKISNQIIDYRRKLLLQPLIVNFGIARRIQERTQNSYAKTEAAEKNKSGVSIYKISKQHSL